MIHEERGKVIVFLFVFLLTLSLPAIRVLSVPRSQAALTAVILFGLMGQFFRNQDRSISKIEDNLIYAPADGQFVVLEEEEFLKDKRIQNSIFINPFNVHENRIPFSGLVKYFKDFSCEFLFAIPPTSSTEKERTTFVMEGKNCSVLMRQIAWVSAGWIRCYFKENDQVTEVQEMGYMKFGSRVSS